MLTKLRKESKGFTIIEVLIVLAIAGLILLIVFLAVPALQRNSRNTQRRDDIAKALGLVTEYSNNNNGLLPGYGVCGLGVMKLAATNQNNASNVTVEGNYYGRNTGTSCSVVAGATNNAGNVDSFIIATGAKCNGTDAQAGNARDVVALYTLEPSVKQCQAT